MAEKDPVKGRIFHVEDSGKYLAEVQNVVKKDGHEVVLSVGTVAEAFAAIPDMLQQLEVNLALLDGYLPDGHGSQIVAEIKATHDLNLPMIGFSDDGVLGVNINVKKLDGGRALRKAIHDVLNP